MAIKTLGYYPLHYGAEFLRESILSLNDVVDKIIILYTKNPSFGHGTTLQNPDTEDKLKSIVFDTTTKAQWIDVSAGNEGAHRGNIANYTQGYDMVVATDSDEIWKTEDLERWIKKAYEMPFRRYGIAGFQNFFRDFNHVCLDGFRPIRIYKEGGIGEYLDADATIYHFGYAQNIDVLRYKFSCHGHKSELRPNWINEVYLNPNVTTNLHPVAHGIWNLQPFDKTILPEFMRKHPLYNK